MSLAFVLGGRILIIERENKKERIASYWAKKVSEPLHNSKKSSTFAAKSCKDMNEKRLIDIYDSIRDGGFSAHTLQLIDNYTNDILYGRANIHRFNLQEHAGLCTAGAPLIGAYTVCCYARASFEPSRFSSEGQTGSPSNWEIDAKQEEVLQQWAEAQKLWIPESEQWIISTFGPKIAQGAGAKVYYKD